MNRLPRTGWWIALGACILSARAAFGQGGRTLTADAIELHRGHEVAGSAEHALVHGGFTYHFASAANRAAFLAEPARYEIQWGGACARMGPLSGEGSTEWRAVHEGRLYLFASTQCRDTFLKDPPSFLEADDPVPDTTPESAARGRALLERAVEGMGGAAAIDSLRSYATRIEREHREGDRLYKNTRSMVLTFDGRVRLEDAWDEKAWGQVVTPDAAFEFGPGETDDLVETQRAAIETGLSREILLILHRRDLPGTVATHVGSGEVDGTPVELVAIARDGATSTLGIDATSGRILSITYRGRGPRLSFGTLEKRFSDFQRRAGVLVPTAWTVVFEGEPVESMSGRYTSVEINAKIEPTAFARPAGAG